MGYIVFAVIFFGLLFIGTLVAWVMGLLPDEGGDQLERSGKSEGHRQLMEGKRT